MTKDKLEQFINSHRAEFDDGEPDPALFAGIRKPGRRIMFYRYKDLIMKAAAVAAIFVTSYYIHDFLNRYRHQEQSSGSQIVRPAEIVEILIEAEAFYTSQIDMRREEFNTLASDQPEIRHEIDQEMVALDSIYVELKQDLKDNIANEQVIEAMIQNYRIKLNILEEMLQQLQSMKGVQNNNTSQHETEL